MINRTCLFFALVLSLTFAGSTYAADSSNGLPLVKATSGAGVCSLIQDNLKRGVDAKAVTKVNIRLGNEVCEVIKCAIDGGGSLSLILAGAVEAGSTPDVLSRCAVSAGADPSEVAQILQDLGKRLGYASQEDNIVPIDTSTIPENTGSRSVSPSSF